MEEQPNMNLPPLPTPYYQHDGEWKPFDDLYSEQQVREYGEACKAQVSPPADGSVQMDVRRLDWVRQNAEVRTLPDGISYYVLYISKEFPPAPNGRYGYNYADIDMAIDAAMAKGD